MMIGLMVLIYLVGWVLATAVLIHDGHPSDSVDLVGYGLLGLTWLIWLPLLGVGRLGLELADWYRYDRRRSE